MAYSAVVGGLFSSTVEVASQQASDRDGAFNQALVKTLLKVSGHRDLVHNIDVQSSFFPAERYVQSFSYKENPRYTAYIAYQKQLENESDIEGLNAQVAEISATTFDVIPLPYLLAVEFAPKALQAKIKKTGLPIWGNVRAEVMLWILIESGGERELLGTNKESTLIDSLNALSEDYALPISFPLADKIDLQNINTSDLWGLFPDAVDVAKQRYSADGNLMVRVYQASLNSWSANWNLSINGVETTGSLHNVSMHEINDELFSFVSAILAKRFSVSVSDPSDDKTITLEVSNINNFSDYVDVQTFLEDLAPLNSFTLDWVKGSDMSFTLELNSSTEQLKEYLKLSGKLLFLSSTVVSQPSNLDMTQEVGLEFSPKAEIESDVDVVSNFIQVEKYKWLSSTSKTNKK